MEKPTPTIWVLADDRAGNRAQCLGVAERQGLPFVLKEIRYNFLVMLPNIIRGSSLLGLDDVSKALIEGPWPDMVIAAGRRSAPISRFIKRQNPRCKLVHLMWPDAGPTDFDVIVLPAHDSTAHHQFRNVLTVLGAPHRITPKTLATASQLWRNTFAFLPSPRIGVLIGGSAKACRFSHSDFERLGALIAALDSDLKGGVMVTSSRRTGRAGEAAVLRHIAPLPNYSHIWKPGMASEENPFLGILALADILIVTADSISMCSEACASGKPVYLFRPSSISPKHSRFIETLIASGHAHELDEDHIPSLRTPEPTALLDTTETIAQRLREIL